MRFRKRPIKWSIRLEGRFLLKNFRSIKRVCDPGVKFEARTPVGPIAGIIENEFTLIGNKADTRNEIGLEDKNLYTLDLDDMEANKFFYLGHRHRGLISLGHYQGGCEFGRLLISIS